MKMLMIAVLMFVAVGARAQTVATPNPAPTNAEIQTAIQDLTQSATPGKWNGKLDFKTLTPGLYQSLTNADSAYGVGLRAWSLNKGTQHVIDLGLFLGIHRYGAIFNSSNIKDFGGATFAIPGSLLDFALNTNMGATWIPRLKTGILGGYDITRPSAMHIKPDFVGFGVNYPVNIGVTPTTTAMLGGGQVNIAMIHGDLHGKLSLL